MLQSRGIKIKNTKVQVPPNSTSFTRLNVHSYFSNQVQQGFKKPKKSVFEQSSVHESSQWEIQCISNKEGGKWSVGGGIMRASAIRAGGK